MKRSPFGKRLRESQAVSSEEPVASSSSSSSPQPQLTIQERHNIFSIPPAPAPAPSSSTLSAPFPIPSSPTRTRPTSPVRHTPGSPTRQTVPLPPASPTRRGRTDSGGYGDRFVPSRDAGDIRASYHLASDPGSSSSSASGGSPGKSKSKGQGDGIKEQANTLFSAILQEEVTPTSPRRESSPVRGDTPSTPKRKHRLFNYSSPTTSAPSTPTRNSSSDTTTRLDTPTSASYSLSPIRYSSQALLSSPRRQLRSVCKTPYRVLDAPELAEDFYLNLVDWSSTNVLGVGLGSCVYLWEATSAQVNKLCDLSTNTHTHPPSAVAATTGSPSQGDSISSVSWVQRGSTLAVGTLQGHLNIYDAATLALLRSYPSAHTQRIGALSWNSHILSSGSRDRIIMHRDVRDRRQTPFRRGVGHRQEVCGIKWSPSTPSDTGALLASGGNDNKVCIWDIRGSSRPVDSDLDDEVGTSDTPLFKFHEHTAAVKALAWDPHLSGVLATGGGTQDKCIRFWNVNNSNSTSGGTGQLVGELDTGSQVCNLLWSLTSHELVSTHGYSPSSPTQNQICIWKYPSLDLVASLTGHTNRVLYLAMSPDGETIVTGAGDETLRFWSAFPRRKHRDEDNQGGEPGLGSGKLDWAHAIR